LENSPFPKDISKKKGKHVVSGLPLKKIVVKVSIKFVPKISLVEDKPHFLKNSPPLLSIQISQYLSELMQKICNRPLPIIPFV